MKHAISAIGGVLALALAFAASPSAWAQEQPARVFAAASLTNALNDIGKLWEAKGHPAPVNAFAASSTLARQIENGAPADIFGSADLVWMDYLADRKRIVAASRSNVVGNRLVLIAPRGKEFPVTMAPGFDLPAAFKGRLCTGEPDSVPVGIYAKQSLTALGWWPKLGPRIVGTEDVRTALAFVERGACPAGIVYETDAAITDKVAVLGVFPEATHKPIVYPMGLVRGARPEATAYLDFIKGPEGLAVFRRYGFSPPGAEGPARPAVATPAAESTVPGGAAASVRN